MELKTYTGLWQVEKRLYKLYDFTLPVPVSIKQLGIVSLVGIPWIVFLNLVNFPFHAPFHLFWIAPPAIAGFYGNKPVIEGKRLTELIASQVRYVTQSHSFARLIPFKPAAQVAATAELWHTEEPQKFDVEPEVQSLIVTPKDELQVAA